ncbi:hypothetical protein [Ktedonobacter sp. SOSP1-85]|uniref:hypothetical protein n=1 Tax=Ktedonobacter sp. SOSP1-85 TaxID=2778367 RepID=UPI0019154D92|nr:hypothetical protein [Ktedonobacter sp. SOSP1-85]
MPQVDVGNGAEGDEADDDQGQDGEQEESEHLVFAQCETHGWHILSGCGRVCHGCLPWSTVPGMQASELRIKGCGTKQ